jgi:selenocysteine-specific elongation factor
VKSVIVGTAGHIDHGKTSLVKALTGIDADRLEEEKRRGITIDIGFAHLELPGARLGFVDVPGHERFVRNMLAGIGGIDLVLLVVAADEGIKPQTREHFDICRLLAVRRGMTVLTKADMVDRETLGVVRMEVEEFLRGSFLDAAHAPIVAASATTGQGMEDVKRELARLAAEAPARDSSALFRLPIDRVFSMKGFGTVVTGTLISGAVSKEEEVEVFPSGQRARVRGVQVHDQPVERALAGQRTALNLAGIEKDQLTRGMTLAAAGLFRPTLRIDVSLSLLDSARPLKDRSRVHFHAYTSEVVAEIVLLGHDDYRLQPGEQIIAKELAPGETGVARLRLSEPVLLLPGDRFILRQLSPVVTIGGGEVLDVAPQESRSHSAEASFISGLARCSPAEWLRARITARGDRGMTLAEAVATTGIRQAEIEKLIPSLGSTRRVANVLLAELALGNIESSLPGVVEQFQRQNPLAPGMNIQELRGRLREVLPEVFDAVLAQVIREGKLELLGDLVRVPGRGAQLRDEESESKEIIERAFATAGLKVPALKDVLASLKVDRARAQKIVTLLLRERVLVKLADDLVFHRHALEQLRARMGEEKTRSPQIDVARFKELTGVSRKYAIPLLEWLDRERVTRRVGDVRVIL